MMKEKEAGSYWADSFAHDRLLKRDYEGPKVLVSFAVRANPLPEFHNVVLNTGMPRTNEDLDRVRMGAANYILGRSQYDYEKLTGHIPEMFIIDIKEV